MNLTQHFTLEEFQRDRDHGGFEVIPGPTVVCFTAFCEQVLEPLRAKFNEPWIITSGYRSPQANHRIGGAPTSQHIATAEHCAADGYFQTYRKDMRPVFDFLRLESKLPFDQCILEWGKYGSIIHLSYVRSLPRRVALEGETFNHSGYKNWPVEFA